MIHPIFGVPAFLVWLWMMHEKQASRIRAAGWGVALPCWLAGNLLAIVWVVSICNVMFR